MTYPDMLEIPLARPCPRYAPDEYQETLCDPALPEFGLLMRLVNTSQKVSSTVSVL